MRIIYGYRYGIVGGVSTQLLLRQAALYEVGISCDLFFCQDNGLRQIVSNSLNDRVFFGSVKDFRRLVSKERYDSVVIVDTPELFFVGKHNLYLDVHTTTSVGLDYLSRIDSEMLSGVLVPSFYSAGLVSSKIGLPLSKINIIPNIVDAKIFNLTVVCSASINREFIWVGKFDQHKNWRLALVYARMLKDLLGSIRFYMVGGYTAPTDVSEDFFRLLQELDLQDSVVWLDRLANNHLAALFRRCANSGGAMLITSRDESFGMAAAEALLCGCPLIANDLPVFREVFPESPMVQRVDIWQPDQVMQAISQLSANTITESDRSSMFEVLFNRYGATAFVTALNKMINGE